MRLPYPARLSAQRPSIFGVAKNLSIKSALLRVLIELPYLARAHSRRCEPRRHETAQGLYIGEDPSNARADRRARGLVGIPDQDDAGLLANVVGPLEGVRPDLHLPSTSKDPSVRSRDGIMSTSACLGLSLNDLTHGSLASR